MTGFKNGTEEVEFVNNALGMRKTRRERQERKDSIPEKRDTGRETRGQVTRLDGKNKRYKRRHTCPLVL